MTGFSGPADWSARQRMIGGCHEEESEGCQGTAIIASLVAIPPKAEAESEVGTGGVKAIHDAFLVLDLNAQPRLDLGVRKASQTTRDLGHRQRAVRDHPQLGLPAFLEARGTTLELPTLLQQGTPQAQNLTAEGTLCSSRAAAAKVPIRSMASSVARWSIVNFIGLGAHDRGRWGLHLRANGLGFRLGMRPSAPYGGRK